MSDILVGPNRCHTCGGEYGDHADWCSVGKRREISTDDKCDTATAILTEWAEKQGHNRCWYYPEVFERLCALFGVSVSRGRDLPPRKEFEEGCRRYQCEQYGKNRKKGAPQ